MQIVQTPPGSALGILKAVGVMLPIASACIYFIGPHIPGQDGVLIFSLIVTVFAGVGGYYLGSRHDGKRLTVAGLSGYFVFIAMIALLAFYVSKPIPIPPYP